MTANKKEGVKVVAENRKARHDYHILERMEAGIVLTGTEVKSIRQGRANLNDSYAQIKKGELYLIAAHVSPYEHGNRFNPDPLRRRKLLMHRREINKLYGRLKQDGLTLIPLKMYFRAGKVKLELGLAKGKKDYDKRQSEAKRTAERQMANAVKHSDRE